MGMAFYHNQIKRGQTDDPAFTKAFFAIWLSDNALNLIRLPAVYRGIVIARLGAFFEIMPLAGFFVGFHYYGLFIAAVISVGLAGIVWGHLVACWFFAPFPLFSLVLSAGFTAAAVLFDAAFSSRFNQPFSMVYLRLYCRWLDETRHDAGVFCQTIFSDR